VHGVRPLFFDWLETPVFSTFSTNPKSKIQNRKFHGGVLDSTLGWIMMLPFEDEGWPR